MGTMTMGEQNDEAQSYELLDYCMARGVNFFDTAGEAGGCRLRPRARAHPRRNRQLQTLAPSAAPAPLAAHRPQQPPARCSAGALGAPCLPTAAPPLPWPPPTHCCAALSQLTFSELYPVPPRQETVNSTEKILGRWMAARGNREQVRVARMGLHGAAGAHTHPRMGPHGAAWDPTRPHAAHAPHCSHVAHSPACACSCWSAWQHAQTQPGDQRPKLRAPSAPCMLPLPRPRSSSRLRSRA